MGERRTLGALSLGPAEGSSEDGLDLVEERDQQH